MLSQETIKKLAQEVKDAAEAWQEWKNAQAKATKAEKEVKGIFSATNRIDDKAWEEEHSAREEAENAENYAKDSFIQLRTTLIDAVRDDEDYPEPETTSWDDEDEKAVISHASTLSDEIYELYGKNDDDDYYLVSKAFEALSTLHEKELPYAYETPDQLFIEFCDEIASANE